MKERLIAIVFLLAIATVLSPVYAQSYLCNTIQGGVLGKVSDPHNCSSYFECFNGQIVGEGSCPNGYWFDAGVQTCVLQSDTTCSEYPVNPECTAGLVDYYPYPYDCNKYIECYHGVEEVHSCPSGLWFNSAQKRCVDQSVSDCGIYTIEPPWTTPPATCYGVRPDQIILRPYPGDCSRYYACYGSSPIENQCTGNLWFDESRQLCDWPELVNCEWGGDNPPTIPPGTGIDDPRCYDGNIEYWPYPVCSQFVECYNGLGYVMDCPDGLYFDSGRKVCTYPSDADCGGVGPTYSPPTTEPNWTPDPLCPWPNPDRYLFPYSGDCTRFWVCWYGVKELEVCPPGLYFNPILLVCDYPYEAGCRWGKSADEEALQQKP